MRKISLLLILLICFSSACTKQYKNVDEYSSDMKKVRQNLNNYTIIGNIDTLGNVILFKTFIKDNKWKTISSLKDGYKFTYLYDGKDVYLYINDKILVKNPINPYAKQNKISTINGQNPTNPIIDWDFDEFKQPNDEPYKFKNNQIINGYKCRLVYTTDYEACISDKYGIAVYANSSLKNQEIKYNVTKISNNTVPSEEFIVPTGLKTISAEEYSKIK